MKQKKFINGQMQPQILTAQQQFPAKGQIVGPRKECTSFNHVIYHWDRAMIYKVEDMGMSSPLCTLKGINGIGVTFQIAEYADRIHLIL